MENQNKTAFPTLFYNRTTGEPNGHDSGMTLRDYFANSVLQGKMSTEFIGYSSDKDIAEHCYQLADAMLKQREL